MQDDQDSPKFLLQHKRVAVLINAAAGSAIGTSLSDSKQQLGNWLAAAGLQVSIEWVMPAEVTGAIERLTSTDIDVLVVGGGDGTLSTAANVLVDTRIALGVLPLGTFNHFAQDLGMPLALEDAVQALAAGVVRTVDVGECNDRVFINNVSMGIYPYAVRRRHLHQQQLGLSKRAAMGYALLGALWRLPKFRSRIYANGMERYVESPFIFLGNNHYDVESPGVIKRRSLSEGELCLFYTRRPGRLTLLKIALKALFTRLNNVAELEIVKAREAIIGVRRKRVKLAADGEVVSARGPLRFRIRSQALRVIAPAGK